MNKTKEYVSLRKNWEGPITFSFSIVSTHAKTIRFRPYIGSVKFDIYLPKILLPTLPNNKIPEKISVTFSKNKEPIRSIGFKSQVYKASFGTYEYCEEKSNIFLYKFFHDGQNYNLYLPKVLFNNENVPERLNLFVEELPLEDLKKIPPEIPYFFGEVIGSAYKYHKPDCHLIGRIFNRNIKRLHNWEEAVKLGLEPCSICNPYCPSNLKVEPNEELKSISPSILSDYRRYVIRVLDFLEPNPKMEYREGVASRIYRLSQINKIPRLISTLMKVLTEFRNAAEYEKYSLTSAEVEVVESAWKAIKDWAISQGIEKSELEKN